MAVSIFMTTVQLNKVSSLPKVDCVPRILISLSPGTVINLRFFPNGEVESIGRTGGDEGFVKVATVTQPIAIDP